MDALTYKLARRIFEMMNGSDIYIQNDNVYALSAFYSTQTYALTATMTAQTSVDMTKDLIMYFRLKFADNNDYFNFEFTLAGNVKVTLSFGYDWVSNTKNGNAISAKDFVGVTTALIGNVNMYNAAVDVIVWYDDKWGYFNIFCDNVLVGSYKPSDVVPATGITGFQGKSGNTSTLTTFNYFYAASPLITAIGDSITGGATLYAPNPDHYVGVDTYQGYPKLVSDYLKAAGVKNWFVANKGVNGEETDDIQARFNADVIATDCNYAFIHGGTNDYSGINDTAVTTANKLLMVQQAKAAGIKPVLLGVTANKAASAAHAYSIALHAAEKTAYANETYIDLFPAVDDPATPNTALNAKMTDNDHPNVTGYASIADMITDRILL